MAPLSYNSISIYRRLFEECETSLIVTTQSEYFHLNNSISPILSAPPGRDTITRSASQPIRSQNLSNWPIRSHPDIILTMSRSRFAHSESHSWEHFHSFLENISIWFHVTQPMSLSVWKSINFTPSWYWAGGVKSGDKRTDGDSHLASDWSIQPCSGLWLAERMLTRLPWFQDNLTGDREGSGVNILYLWQLRETAGRLWHLLLHQCCPLLSETHRKAASFILRKSVERPGQDSQENHKTADDSNQFWACPSAAVNSNV